MSCEKCNDLCVRQKIRAPNDLRNAMARALGRIHDGTLVDVTEPGTQSASFEAMAADGHWDDLVAWKFQCVQCGEAFSLQAETYHGSGGCWEPVRPPTLGAAPMPRDEKHPG